MTHVSSGDGANALEVGARLNQYTVAGFVGAGGMGEVYRAHDERLGRDVALKILPARFGTDAERTRRFEQEAHATGSINHPNVVSVYDAGEYQGCPFMVTELLEGETLRTRVDHAGAIPVRKAVNLAMQIARGLASAHDRGIVHRDLKPSNIFITTDGHVKILDFGLAKLLRPEEEGTSRDAETLSGLSRPGAVLGSIGYMSPEQVEARAVDHRSDIFTLGIILYEMLTGRRPFSGSSNVATMSAILFDQPPEITSLQPGVGPPLAALVRRCLEKLPEDRYQSARDLAFSLEEMATHSDLSLGSAAYSTIRAAATRARQRPAVSIGVVAALAIAVAWVAVDSRTTASPPPAPSAVTAPPAPKIEIRRLTLSGKALLHTAMSPDGKYALYDDAEGLWLLHVATGSATQVVKAPVGYLGIAKFSPDGNYIYFARWDDATNSTNFYRVPILGGDAQMLIKNVMPESLTFTRDGGRLAFIREDEQAKSSTLLFAAADGTNETKLATREMKNQFLSCAWSPDGVTIVCCGLKGHDFTMFEVHPVTGVQKEHAWPMVGRLEWVPDGRALIGVDNSGVLIRLSYPGGVSSRITTDLNTYSWISASGDGSTAVATRVDVTTNLWAINVQTRALRQITTGVNTQDGNFGVEVTADHRIVWASGASGKSIDLMVAELDGSGRKRITFDDQYDERWPDSSHDGRHVVFARWEKGTRQDVWRVNADGSELVRLTTEGGGNPKYSHDGSTVYFRRGGDKYLKVGANGGAAEPSEVFSPDGKWIVKQTDVGLELRATSGSARKMLKGVGGIMAWSADGQAIAFLKRYNGSGNLAVQRLNDSEVQHLTQFTTGEQVAWGFDWTPDGKEIVFSRRTRSVDVVEITGLK